MLKIYISPPRRRRRRSRFTRLGSALAGWIPRFYSLRKAFCLKRRERQTRFVGKPLFLVVEGSKVV